MKIFQKTKNIEQWAVKFEFGQRNKIGPIYNTFILRIPIKTRDKFWHAPAQYVKRDLICCYFSCHLLRWGKKFTDLRTKID